MGKRRNRQITLFGLIFGLALIYIILNNIDRIGDIGGDWTTITNNLISYFPSLVGIGLGFVFSIRDVGNKRTKPLRLFLLFTLLGVSFAGLFFEMNSDSIWIDELLTATFTITEFQLVVVLFFIVLGMIMSMIRR